MVAQNGWTVLHGAARYGRQDMVTYLLEAGCDANARDSVSLRCSVIISPLRCHCTLRMLTLSVQCLCFYEQKGWTALVYACEHGHTEAVLALMSAGADSNVQTNVSSTVTQCLRPIPADQRLYYAHHSRTNRRASRRCTTRGARTSRACCWRSAPTPTSRTGCVCYCLARSYISSRVSDSCIILRSINCDRTVTLRFTAPPRTASWRSCAK
jgi:hypothetical protein